MSIMPDRITLEDVRHVARLARLRLDDAQLEEYRAQLADVLDHVARLEAIDVTGIEPMAHPGDARNRPAADVPGPVLSVADVLANAPAVEGDAFAVPKVLDDGGSGA